MDRLGVGPVTAVEDALHALRTFDPYAARSTRSSRPTGADPALNARTVSARTPAATTWTEREKARRHSWPGRAIKASSDSQQGTPREHGADRRSGTDQQHWIEPDEPP